MIFLIMNAVFPLAFSIVGNHLNALEMYLKSLNWRQVVVCSRHLAYNSDEFNKLVYKLSGKPVKHIIRISCIFRDLFIGFRSPQGSFKTF